MSEWMNEWIWECCIDVCQFGKVVIVLSQHSSVLLIWILATETMPILFASQFGQWNVLVHSYKSMLPIFTTY